MSLQIKGNIKRIATLFAIAGMLVGFFSPADFNEFYNNLLRLNGQPYEFSYVNTGLTHDCINSGKTASHNPYRPEARRSGNARTDLQGFAGGYPARSACSVLVNHLFILLLGSLMFSAALSYYHIEFIHLKDGHK